MLRLLLDTHAFLWWIMGDPQSSTRVRQAIAVPEDEVYVSAASAWKIAIKASLGRPRVPDDLDGCVAREMRRSRFRSLAIDVRQALGVADPPPLRRDPFDRLLVPQVLREDLTLVSADPWVARYSVSVLW